MFNAVILCGGFGTRLKSVVSDMPKPMALVKGKPFLEYIIDYLIQSKVVSSFILCTGYKHEQIYSYFGTEFKGFPIDYSVERQPLGTGGAIANAIPQVRSDSFILVNGDTLFKINLKEMIELHTNEGADLTIALKLMYNFDRYGSVECKNSRIISFQEKKKVNQGLINGGVYVINKRIFSESYPEVFSFEKDLLEKNVNSCMYAGFQSEGYFIDIGIPEDYKRAQSEM